MARHTLRLICLVAAAIVLAACDGGGGDSASNTGASTGSPAPGAPVATSPSGNAQTTSSVTLEWNPNVESDLVGYKIYRASASGAYGPAIATVAGALTTLVVNGLQPGTHFFVVAAVDRSGNESGLSNEVSKVVF